MVASNYTLSGSVVVGYADKLDAGFRLPSELTLEEGASGQFTVRLTTSPEENTNDADVTVTIAQPAASTGVTVDTDTSTSNNQNTLTFTGANWYTAQTVYVSTTEDADAAVPADLTLSLSATGGGSGDYSYAAATGSVTLKQTEKNTAGLTLTPTDLDVRRDGSNTFTVQLQAQPTANVTVTLTQPASSTGVTADTDTGTANNQTELTFTSSNWDDAQTVTVSATGTAPLGDDAATISLAASGATEYASVTGSVMIDVEDKPPGLILDPTDLDVRRDGSNTFTVELTVQPSDEVEVTLTQPASSTGVTADTDTSAANNQTTLTFTTANWNTAQTVTVSATGTAPLGDDAATISLSASGSDATEYASVTGSVTIDVEDRPPGLILDPTDLDVHRDGSNTFTVELTVQPSDEVEVTLTQPASSTGVTADTDTSAANNQTTLTFTTTNWNTAQTVTVSATGTAPLGDDAATISLSASGSDATEYASVTGSVTIDVEDRPAAGLTLTPTDLDVRRDGSNTFTVELQAQPSDEVEVTLTQPASSTGVTVDTDTGTANNQTTLTFTTTNWNTAQTVTVSATGTAPLGDDAATISLSASGSDATEYASVTGSVTIDVEDRPPGLILDPTDLDVRRDGSNTFTVELTVQPSDEVEVTLTQPASSTGVTVDTDTGAANNQTTLTFTSSNWDDAQTVTVSATGTAPLGDDAATISLSASGSDATEYASVTGSVTIDVEDRPPGLILDPTDLDVRRDGSNTFTVELQAQPSDEVEVTLTQPASSTGVTVDQTTLTFTTANWNTAQTVTVSATGTAPLGDDAATISLSASGSDATEYASVTGSVTIDVEDKPPGLILDPTDLDVRRDGSNTFTVELTVQPTANVTVTLTQPASSTGVTADTDTSMANNQTELTFTSSNWDDAQTVTVSATGTAPLGNDAATISLAASGATEYASVTGSVTIDVEDRPPGLTITPSTLTIAEGGNTTFMVKLSRQPTAAVTVMLTQPTNTDVTVDTDTSAANNQTELMFTTTNWNVDQSVMVSADQDADNTDDEATVSLSASGASEYAGVTRSMAVTVTDDESFMLTITPSTLTIAEGGNTTFMVKLSRQPTAAVTVMLTQPTNTDVTVDTDTSAANNQTELMFTTTNWNVDQSVAVSAGQDADNTDDEATVSLSASGASEYAGATGSVMVTVFDDESLELTLTPSTLTIAEGGNTTFMVKLNRQPTAAVTLMLTQPTNTDVTVDTDTSAANNQTELMFTTTNWNVDQSVAVSAGQDADNTDDEATVSLSAAGGGYDGVTGSVAVTVTDDESFMLTLTPGTLMIDEGESDTFMVKLSRQPTAAVTVMLTQPSNTDVTVDTDTSAANNQTELMFTTTNWNVDQSVMVSAAQDADNTHDQATVSLAASGASEYAGVSGSVTVSVTDDEAPGLTITPSALIIDEGGNKTFAVKLAVQPTATVTLMLTQPSNTDVTVDTDTSAANNQTELMFTTTNWNVDQSVTVSAAQDTDNTHDSATISLAASGASEYAGVSGSVTVTVTDDEAPGLTITPSAVTVEEGKNATFTVKPEAAPTANVTVTLTQPTNTDVMVDTDTGTAGDQTTLTFTSANWETAQTVTVRAGQDTDSADDTASIALSAAGGGFDNITASVTVSVTDDDKGATLEQEEEAAAVILAEVVGAMLPAASDAIGVRFDASRTGRTATVAGQQVALDRSLAQDLAAGFASRAGVQDTSQGRFAEDSFGAERHSGEWLGGIPLDAGRPLRSAGERSSGLSGASALLSDFSYALNANGSGGAGWSIWGRFDTGEFSGTNDDVEFDSSQSSIWFGADRRSDSGLLSGVAYSSSSTDADYTLGRFGAALETDLTLVLPYAETEFASGATGHAMLGIGSGEATITQTDRRQGSADLSVYMLAAGASWPTAWELGSGSLSWSGDFGYTSLSTSGGALASLDGLSVSSMQIKGGLELAFDEMGGALRASPRAALLMRLDSGDGVTGTGFELTGGMLMTSSSSDRFSVDVNLRTLIMHSAEDLTDWGMSIQARFNARSDGSGLGLALGPHWGSPDDGLLERDEAFRLDEAGRQSRQLNQRDRGLAGSLGYGLRAFGGMLTPYTEYRFTSGNAGSIRQVAGVRFSDSEALELSLFSERHIARLGEARSRLAVELQKRF